MSGPAEGIMEQRIYTTWGHVRGACGHRHTSPSTAATCLRIDADGCHAQGGYSDRRIYSLPVGSAVKWGRIQPRGRGVEIHYEPIEWGQP